MVKESPFKSIRITLSEDAIVMLDGLKRSGKFRSYSAAVEETIRTLHDLLTEHAGLRYRINRLGEREDAEETCRLLESFGEAAFKRLMRFVGLNREREIKV